MEQKYKTPKKGAVKRMRDFYEKNRGKASPELLEILNSPEPKKDSEKKSALPQSQSEAEI